MTRRRKYTTVDEATEANRTRARDRYRALKHIEREAPLYMQEKQRLAAEAKSKGCCVCHEKEVCTLDFHHLDPTLKEFNLSWQLHRRRSLKKFVEELDKCVVVCSNCHRKIHAGVITL